jgi:hypothetical protein
MSISPINPAMTTNTPNFKGANFNSVKKVWTSAKDSFNKGYDKMVEDVIIDKALKPIVNSNVMTKLVDKTAHIDSMASHMSTAGSFVTTATYANRTLKTFNQDEEQKKRAKTLALNQVMVTGVSTLGAYTFNKQLDKLSKNLGYKFREANQGNPKLTTRMQGFNIAKQLLIFSVMYRYVAPVIVTPLASKISKCFENRRAMNAQKQAANQQNTTIANK